MVRVATLTRRLTIWIFPNDHAPPHFHVISPDTDVLINIRTLEVIVGNYRRRDLAEAIAWAAEPENQAMLFAKWDTLNEQG